MAKRKKTKAGVGGARRSESSWTASEVRRMAAKEPPTENIHVHLIASGPSGRWYCSKPNCKFSVARPPRGAIFSPNRELAVIVV